MSIMGRRKTFEPESALGQAMTLFRRVGFHAASMDALVRKMGVSRQSLYDTFGDKRALFRRVLARYRETTIASEFSMLRSGSPARGLGLLCANWAGFGGSTDDESVGCLLTNSLIELRHTEPELFDDVRAVEKELQSQIRLTLDRAAEEGDLRLRDETENLAGLLLLIRHSAMMDRRTGSGEPSRALLNQLLKAIGLVDNRL